MKVLQRIMCKDFPFTVPHRSLIAESQIFQGSRNISVNIQQLHEEDECPSVSKVTAKHCDACYLYFCTVDVCFCLCI